MRIIHVTPHLADRDAGAYLLLPASKSSCLEDHAQRKTVSGVIRYPIELFFRLGVVNRLLGEHVSNPLVIIKVTSRLTHIGVWKQAEFTGTYRNQKPEKPL
jgi:hypothetical protein